MSWAHRSALFIAGICISTNVWAGNSDINTRLRPIDGRRYGNYTLHTGNARVSQERGVPTSQSTLSSMTRGLFGKTAYGAPGQSRVIVRRSLLSRFTRHRYGRTSVTTVTPERATRFFVPSRETHSDFYTADLVAGAQSNVLGPDATTKVDHAQVPFRSNEVWDLAQSVRSLRFQKSTRWSGGLLIAAGTAATVTGAIVAAPLALALGGGAIVLGAKFFANARRAHRDYVAVNDAFDNDRPIVGKRIRVTP